MKEADVPELMDVQTKMKGVTPEGLTEARNADLAIQDDKGGGSQAGLTWSSEWHASGG